MLDIKLLQNDFETICEKLRKKKVKEDVLNKLRAISVELKKKKKF